MWVFWVHSEAGKWGGNCVAPAGVSQNLPGLQNGLFLLTKKTIKAVCLERWLMDCMDYLFIYF